jgi:hypothetical protein
LSAKTVLAGGGALNYFQPSFWKSALPPGARLRRDLNPSSSSKARVILIAASVCLP